MYEICHTTKEDLVTLIKVTQDGATSNAEGDTSLMPCLLVRTVNDEGKIETGLLVIAANFNDHDEKRLILEGMGAKLYQMRRLPIAACLVTEAWKSPMGEGQPRDHPNKQECLMIQAISIQSPGEPMHLFSDAPVTRDRSNKMHVGKWTDPVEGECILLLSLWHGIEKLLPRPEDN
jgi:hypothetical protein